MPGWLIWTIVLVIVGFVLDRCLLWMEARGWLNYRRNRLSRGAAVYHALELHSIFDPGTEEVIEVRYAEEQEEDDSGEPPA